MGNRILVIDDDVAIRKAFSLVLEDQSYEVATACNGREGVSKFREKEYDLVYLDLKMPEMDGLECLREIRSQNQMVPIYIVTAFHNDYTEQLKAAANEGIDFQLLKKPIGMEQILEVTSAILS